MQYFMLERAVDYLRPSLYTAQNAIQKAFNPLISGCGLEIAFAGVPFTNNNYEAGKYWGIFYSRQKKHWAKPKEVKMEVGRSPNFQPMRGLFSEEGVDWNSAKDPYEKAKRIMEASKVGSDDPRYKNTKKPSSEDKRWARNLLSNPVEPTTIDEIVGDSNGHDPVA